MFLALAWIAMTNAVKVLVSSVERVTYAVLNNRDGLILVMDVLKVSAD